MNWLPNWLTAPTPAAHAVLIWALGVFGGALGAWVGIWSVRRNERYDAQLNSPGVLRASDLRRRSRHL